MVPNPSSLLMRIPDEFKPMAALGLGALVLVLLVLFHGLSLHRILIWNKRGELTLRSGRPHTGGAAFLFGWSVFLMLSLHIMEIAVWAFTLVHLGLATSAENALYFCANAYTTLGYGVVDLGPHWRIISPIIAISGLFTFAWTTSSLVNIVTNHLKLVQQLERERMKQFDMRRELRRAERDASRDEGDAERASRDDARARARSASFLEGRRIWREERAKEHAMRASTKQKLDELRRKEREEEEKLGPEMTPTDEDFQSKK